MIDKINNINTANVQNKRSTEDNKAKTSVVVKSNVDSNKNIADTDNIEISSNSGVANMAKSAPVDLNKVSAIKNALSRGDYPVDLEKVADALLQAYKDIK